MSEPSSGQKRAAEDGGDGGQESKLVKTSNDEPQQSNDALKLEQG